ncbi:hypothetical protein KSP39_PZI018219 [Platanthera zijinensis]|uniref:Uncharacterized protein n=1 Tax=Platanthera zijinensis TaxID=2320716 RepID=A0AAP0B3L0_9ASPA
MQDSVVGGYDDDALEDLLNKYGKVVYQGGDLKKPSEEAEDDAESLSSYGGDVDNGEGDGLHAFTWEYVALTCSHVNMHENGWCAGSNSAVGGD